MYTVSIHHPSIGAVPRPKTVLFCPECGHESGLHGDWILDEDVGRPTRICPVCETALGTRQ